MYRNVVSCLMIVSLAFGVGCGQAKPMSNSMRTPVVDAAETVSTTASTESTPAFSPPLVATAVQGSAESTFQQTLIAFQEGRLDTAFDLLPASYQTDVNDLVHEFAGKMDAELWSNSFSLLGKFSKLMKTKKAWFLNLDLLKQAPQFASIKPHWDAIASGIDEVAFSEVADLSRLKQTDVRGLLSSAAELTSGLPLPNFGDVKVTTLKSKDDSATLSYYDSKDATPKEVEFVRVEGKWLPKSIATNWSGSIADARKGLSELPDRVSSVKPQLMKQLATIDGMLDQLQNTKTAEEFTQAIIPLFVSIALEAQMAQQSLQNASGGSRKDNAVFCVINRELADDEQTKLKEAIMGSFENSKLEYEMIPNNGKTRCRFTPVPDAEALVAAVKKHFEGASVRFDGETKTIQVDTKN